MCIEFGVFLFALRQCVRQIWYLYSGVAHRCKKTFCQVFFLFWSRFLFSKYGNSANSLRSLRWLKINERIEYKLLSLTYKVLTTTQPSYLYNLILITVQPPRSTRSSSLVTLARPPTSSLRITDRSFQYASPRLWNQLPAPLRQPRTNLSNSASPISLSGISSIISSIDSPLSVSHHPSPLQSSTPGLKLSFSTNLSHHSLPFLLLD